MPAGAGAPAGVSPPSSDGGGTVAIDWVDDLPTVSLERQAEITARLAAGGVVVATAAMQPLALARMPLEWGLRTAQVGIVIGPQRAQDGEFFEVRLDVAGPEPKGRAVLLESGRRQWFQFPGARQH